MGRSTTPKYVVNYNTGRGHYNTPIAWNSRYSGRPTAANLAKWVKVMEDSSKPGECNVHLGRMVIWSAKIVRNDGSRSVVAEYKNSASFVIV